jgi:hypothetical protein
MKIITLRHLYTAISALLLMTIFVVSIPTHKAEAGGADGRATLGMQITQQAELAVSAIQNTLTAASTGITAGNTTSLVLKENVLDGIGWAIAKQMVSSMTRSLINWINSGFEGSPAFITDLNAFLLDALDTAAGEYIRSLGGIGEFICSPFQLDIQAALSVSYAQARSGQPSGPTAPACRLTDIANNIEGFFAGINEGGWSEWLSVTSNPQNTPYGAFLEAQTRMKIKLKNEAGQEMEVASWGDGFLSKKICETIEGSSGGEQCTITTPGQVISEALTFQLSTGPRSLIEADEINELIGALLNQLVLQAMQGINGLLGLSAGGGSDSGGGINGSSTASYLDQMVEESFIDTTTIKTQMDASLVTERGYLTLASSTLSEASRRLTLVNNAQTAIASFFSGNNAGAELANLTRSDTIRTARSKVSNLLGDRPTTEERAALVLVQNQLTAIENSLTVISTMSDSRGLGNDLTTITFAVLESEATTILGELTILVSELSTVVPRVISNVTKLTNMITLYETATATVVQTRTGSSTATTTRSVRAIRNDIALEYASLVSGNNLTSQIIIDQNRTRWRERLRL